MKAIRNLLTIAAVASIVIGSVFILGMMAGLICQIFEGGWRYADCIFHHFKP